jgi:hypothetical protein
MSQIETETLNHDRACRDSNGPPIARNRYTAPDPDITAELSALGNPPPTPQRVTPTMLRSHGALARSV